MHLKEDICCHSFWVDDYDTSVSNFYYNLGDASSIGIDV